MLRSRKPAEAVPAALEPLAVLPVFHDLKEKPVLVAGATAAAAWKADLLRAAGAHVLAVGEGDAGAFADLGAREAGHLCRFAFTERTWRAEDLTGCAMAICDAADRAEAQRFAEAARAAGVPVNVIDKPEFCDFSFGSIVNRSPVVVGISTAGAAPVLGQAIRRRVETLLPQGLSRWAAAAAALRGRVMAALDEGAPRRIFWRAIAERAFHDPENTSPSGAIGRALDRVSRGEGKPAADHAPSGRVTLVGAGPGDAELLTLKAVRALQNADVILFDDLVSAEVLELARREAKRMAVGKRGHKPSCRQDEINALMIKLARQGKRVVRLKSGDPMIFGRAGEEIADLDAAGIPVDIIPGITAALGAAASLGVSLTHRDHARSVRFVTGHARTGELPEDLDWRGLADPKTTLMIYMGGKTVPLLAGRLMAQGLPRATPAVLISNVSRPDETRIVRTIGELEADAHPETEGPVLIGVGSVFRDLRADRQNAPRMVPDFCEHPRVRHGPLGGTNVS